MPGDPTDAYIVRDDISLTPDSRRFEQVADLAARLGVSPTTEYYNAVVFQLPDGRRYDLFAMINALLDRIDQAAK